MIEIRQAQEPDLPTILEIERDNMLELVTLFNPFPWSDEDCFKQMQSSLNQNHFWITGDDSGILGYYYFSPMKDPEKVSLDSVQVVKARQCQGIGTMLMVDFLKRVREQGFKIACLNVFPGNKARNLYTRLGFRETKRTGKVILMEKDLGDNVGIDWL